MKVYEHRWDDELVSFEISNTLIGRRGAWRIASTVPGVTMITRRPILVLGWLGMDEFCRFKVGDVEFGIEEPYGDNSRYLISALPARHVPEIETVVQAFHRANPWNFIF